MEKEKSGRPGQQQLLLYHHHHHHHHGRCNLITTGTVQQRHQPKKFKKSLKIRQLSWTPIFLCVLFPLGTRWGTIEELRIVCKDSSSLWPVFLKKKAATMNALYSPVHTWRGFLSFSSCWKKKKKKVSVSNGREEDRRGPLFHFLPAEDTHTHRHTCVIKHGLPLSAYCVDRRRP